MTSRSKKVPAPLVMVNLIQQIELELEPALSVGISAPGLATADACSIYFIPGKMQDLVGSD